MSTTAFMRLISPQHILILIEDFWGHNILRDRTDSNGGNFMHLRRPGGLRFGTVWPFDVSQMMNPSTNLGTAIAISLTKLKTEKNESEKSMPKLQDKIL